MAQQHIIQSTVRRIFCFRSRTWSGSTFCEPDHLVANSSSIQSVRLMWMSAHTHTHPNRMMLRISSSASKFWTTDAAHSSMQHTHLDTVNSLWSYSLVDPFQTRIPKTKTTALTSAHLTENTTPKSPFQLVYKIVTFCVSVSLWARYYWYY